MKNLLLLCACLLALAAPLRAAVAPPADIVLVRITGLSNADSFVITRGEGKSETVEVKRGQFEKARVQTSEGYYKILQPLYQEGYVLQSSFSAPGLITLVFVKPKS